MRRLIPSLILLAALISSGSASISPAQSNPAFEGRSPGQEQAGPDPDDALSMDVANNDVANMEVAVTRWVNPTGEGPLSYAEWQTSHPRQPFHLAEPAQLFSADGTSTAGPALLLLVESVLHAQIEPEITRYLADLQNEGFQVYWAASTGGDPADIRSLLRAAWLQNGIEGVLIVGDFPVPWYEMDDDFYGPAEFPIDLYYMDLDGEWADADHDDLFEFHTAGDGDLDLEIYLGRLTGSPLSSGSLDVEAALMRNYFLRDHAYRTGSFYRWVEINKSGTPAILGAGASQEVALPFPFTFYGETYTSVYINADGYLSFETGATTGENTCLPETAGPNAAIYAWWDDLETSSAGGSGEVYYHQAGEDTFLVEWDRVQRSGTAETVTFELILHRDGTVIAQYKSVDGFDSASIGLENGSGRNAAQYSCDGSGGAIERGEILVFSPLDSYSHAYGSAAWEEINTTGTPLNLSDDGSIEVWLPFPFSFYGTAFSSVFINANGFLTFGQGSAEFANACLPNLSQPDNAIYAWWENLLPGSAGGTGKIYYHALDPDTFVVEWDRVRRHDSSDQETFQILLRRDGSVSIQYETVTAGILPTAGLESVNSSRSLPNGCYSSYGFPVSNGIALHASPISYGSYRPYGLAYVDNDWYGFGESSLHYLQLLYGEEVDNIWAVSPADETTRNDYLAHLGKSPQFAHVMSHGWSGGHVFSNEFGSGEINTADVEIFNPPAQFYNLFICSGTRYVENDYVGGKYILDPYGGTATPLTSTAGLVAVGSTKTGSMLDFDRFYGPLGMGKSFGQSYLDWFNQAAQDGFELMERQWFYGMSLLGDPTLRVRNPAPSLASLNPSMAVAGEKDLTVTVLGQDFVQGAVVRLDGTDLETVFISPAELAANVPPSAIALAGPAEISVFNPAPGGGATGSLLLEIVNPVPALSSLDPETAFTGDPDLLLTVEGMDFVPGSVVRWDGADLATGFVSETRLTAEVPGSSFGETGTASITVLNPEPGGGLSDSLSFAILNPAPLLESLEPDSLMAGGPTFTLVVHGEKFLPGAVVLWDGLALATTFTGSDRLSGIVPADKIETAGAASVTVRNPDPTTGPSGARIFTVHPWLMTYLPNVWQQK